MSVTVFIEHTYNEWSRCSELVRVAVAKINFAISNFKVGRSVLVKAYRMTKAASDCLKLH